MAFSKLTASQIAALSRITTQKRKLTFVRQDVHARIEKLVEEEIQLEMLALTTYVREAAVLKNGDGRITPKAAIKRALGSSDHASLQGMLEGMEVVVIQPVTWHPESRTVTIADFTFGNESIRGGTYDYDPGPYRGILYFEDGMELGNWIRSKFDLGEDVMREVNALTNGWERQAREQGAK